MLAHAVDGRAGLTGTRPRTLPSNDPLIFNIVAANDQFMCPCCGMTDQFTNAPYDEKGGIIGSGICASCFWEPGFDDSTAASAVTVPRFLIQLQREFPACIRRG
jgi:hypothetical protein